MATNKRRKRDPEKLSEGMGDRYAYPSEFIDDIREGKPSAEEELHQNRYNAFHRDARFRDKFVKFDHAEDLMDLKSTDTDEEGIPARNRIRRIVEDLLSIVQPNMPSADLQAAQKIDPNLSKEEKRKKVEFMRETEKIANRLVERTKRRSDFENELKDILYDSVVDGVGYAHPRLEEMPSRLRQEELDAMLMKGMENWGVEELNEFAGLVDRPYTSHVEARDVYWREGVRSVDDEEMTRVSRHRVVDVQWLRDHFNETGVLPGENRRGKDLGYLYMRPDEDADEDRAGFAETWQIEKFVTEAKGNFSMFPGRAAERQWTVEYEDAIMVYTAITTNELLDYRVLTPKETPMALPFIPFYVKTSKRHPYGFSVPLMLELSQKFANRMRQIMVNQALNSVSPQAFAVFLEHLGGQDREEIERALTEGGAAFLEGNDTQNIRDIIQGFPNSQQGVNSALLQTVRSEEQAMQQQGQSVDPAMLSKARSASGKAAIQNAADRPKNYAILNLSEAVEHHAERLWKLQQRSVGTEEKLVQIGEGAGEGVVLNETVKEPVVETDASGRPMFNEAFKTPLNPSGLVKREKTFTRADMTTPMKAVSDNRGVWPSGLRAKLQLASAMSEAEVLRSNETVRDIVLDKRTRRRDDLNAEEEQPSQREQQMLRLLQQAQQQTQGQGGAQANASQGSSIEGTQNPDLAPAAQDGFEQTTAGGNAGPREEQVGQRRGTAEEELVRQLDQGGS